MPGLIEGHSHLMAGTFWKHPYCGYFDVTDHRGGTWSGCKSLQAVLDHLTQFERQLTEQASSTPLFAWGFDPIYFSEKRCTREDLDRISQKRPIGILHASGHILNVNSAALKAAGLLRSGVQHPGMPLGADGLPTGELRGPDAMGPCTQAVGLENSFLNVDAEGTWMFGQLCIRAGVTTATDLAAGLSQEEVATLQSITSHPDYPVRLVPLLRLMGITPEEAVAKAVELKGQSTERLSLGRIKVIADGSIQGFTARLNWPGYHNGAPNGLWYTPPQTIEQCYTLALKHNIQVHTHTNGDQATDLAIACMQTALSQHPRADHRFFLQHAQLTNTAQFRKLKALGMGVNLFANHHFYWGDQHYELTVGPERAMRMNACASALREQVPMAIHSDAPITPLAPLFTAWCAVNRLTASGRTLGQEERISVEQALYAITMGAAYSLQLDHEIGSLECGKRADLCILEQDPLGCSADSLKDLKVLGTVQAGRHFAVHEPAKGD